MSALITAERGRTYLTIDGERRTVTNVTAHRVMYYGVDYYANIAWMSRARFENEIESVLE